MRAPGSSPDYRYFFVSFFLSVRFFHFLFSSILRITKKKSKKVKTQDKTTRNIQMQNNTKKCAMIEYCRTKRQIVPVCMTEQDGKKNK
jgi:hypothetical protein